MIPIVARVQRTRRETYDTFSLELQPALAEGAFKFAPGQFNMLYAHGVGEVAISISGDPTNPDPVVHTIRAIGTVTRAIGDLKAGDTLGVRGPFGVPWPTKEAFGDDVLIVAGGIGLAPLRPVIYEILANRARYGRVIVLYGTRTPDDLLYRRELEQWRSRLIWRFRSRSTALPGSGGEMSVL